MLRPPLSLAPHLGRAPSRLSHVLPDSPPCHERCPPSLAIHPESVLPDPRVSQAPPRPGRERRGESSLPCFRSGALNDDSPRFANSHDDLPAGDRLFGHFSRHFCPGPVQSSRQDPLDSHSGQPRFESPSQDRSPPEGAAFGDDLLAPLRQFDLVSPPSERLARALASQALLPPAPLPPLLLAVDRPHREDGRGAAPVEHGGEPPSLSLERPPPPRPREPRFQGPAEEEPREEGSVSASEGLNLGPGDLGGEDDLRPGGHGLRHGARAPPPRQSARPLGRNGPMRQRLSHHGLGLPAQNHAHQPLPLSLLPGVVLPEPKAGREEVSVAPHLVELREVPRRLLSDVRVLDRQAVRELPLLVPQAEDVPLVPVEVLVRELELPRELLDPLVQEDDRPVLLDLELDLGGKEARGGRGIGGGFGDDPGRAALLDADHRGGGGGGCGGGKRARVAKVAAFVCPSGRRRARSALPCLWAQGCRFPWSSWRERKDFSFENGARGEEGRGVLLSVD